MREVLAIIPARGGSKGIPRKNIRELAGKPLLAHSIAHALEARHVTRVVVSTDDREIETVATEWGAEVVRRPPAIAGDDSPSEAALIHVLDYLKENEGYEPDLVVFLQPTSPIRKPTDVDAAIDTLVSSKADSLFSSSPQHGFVWRLGPAEPTSVTYDHQRRPRRQDAPTHVMENGSLYVFCPLGLRENNNRLSGRIATYLMGVPEALQIDEEEDLQLAEHLLAGFDDRRAPDLSGIRLLILDFDGVLTDNRVLVQQDGTESVFCHRGDGWGIATLRRLGVEALVVSTEKNPVVAARCKKLDIACVQGCAEKGPTVAELVGKRGLRMNEVAYLANDVNDLPCFPHVGFPMAVADADPEVKACARYVTRARGGRGAVREICDLIARSRR
jgi:YrbI family 3-deoxy-D-manno-octulosonate 8-phosphate phosphatase